MTRGSRSIDKTTFSAGALHLTLLNFVAADAGELGAALAQCNEVVGARNIVRQAFFLRDRADRPAVERTVTEAAGLTRPLTTYVYQPPAAGEMLAAEVWAFAEAVQQHDNYCVASTGDVRWGFVGGIDSARDAGPYAGVSDILSRSQQLLKRAGFAFEEIVRTWYYIGDILGGPEEQRRYNQVNRARNDFYAGRWSDLRNVPASTGIGMRTNNIAFEALALRSEQPLNIQWVHNPLQASPYDYETTADREANPSFSRAAAVSLPGATVIFISGTASIRGSTVISPDDAREQTRVTIENIATLIGEDNLRRFGLERGATLSDLLQYRVYVKRAEDCQTVAAVCKELLPPRPHAAMVADVCRSKFLVEIEGIAAVKNAQ